MKLEVVDLKKQGQKEIKNKNIKASYFNVCVNVLQIAFIALIVCAFISTSSNGDESLKKGILSNYQKTSAEAHATALSIRAVTKGQFIVSEGETFLNRCYVANRQYFRNVFESDLVDFPYYKAISSGAELCKGDSLLKKFVGIMKRFEREEVDLDFIYYFYNGFLSRIYADVYKELGGVI